MGADDRQVRHADLAVADDGHLGETGPVAGEDLPCLAAEALVDLLDDGVDAGELQAEEILVPGLQGLGHDGVVGVGADLLDHIPGAIPRVEVLIHQDAHQLGDAEGGVGIVEVDGHLVGQVVQSAVDRHVVTDDGLHRSRAEEVLLGQTEELTLGMIVGGVQHLGNGIGVGSLLHSAGVLSLREQTHVEILDAASLPETEAGHALGLGARDHHVVGNCLQLLGILVDDLHAAVILPLLVDVTAKAYGKDTVGTGYQPHVTAGQPHVGQLYLNTVHDLLLEKTVLVANGEAGGGVIQGGQGVHEAGGKTAKTAVTQTCIGLTLVQIVQGVAKSRQRLGILLGKAQVAYVGLEGTAQQKFHAHVVHALAAGLIDLLLEGTALLGEDVADGHSRGLVDLLLGGLGRGAAEETGELDLKILADLGRVGFAVGHMRNHFLWLDSGDRD